MRAEVKFEKCGGNKMGLSFLFYLSLLPLMICSGMVYSVFALYIAEFGVSKTQIGLVFTLGSAAGAIFAPILGRLSDKIGRFPILFSSMVGFVLAFASYAVAKNYGMAVAAQILEGTSWAAFTAACTALIADIAEEKKRGLAFGIYNQAWFFGWVIGPFLGGFLADKIGFKWTFFVGAGLTLFGLIFMFFASRKLKKELYRGKN